jgi:hypothetical protein
MMTRTREREEFLADVLVTAIEHGGYGFSRTVEWQYDDANPGRSYAVIYDRYEREDNPSDTTTWRVDIGTIAHGFGVAQKVYKGAESGSLLGDLFTANRTNGDDGDVDVLGALLVLECALFGKQVYS